VTAARTGTREGTARQSSGEVQKWRGAQQTWGCHHFRTCQTPKRQNQTCGSEFRARWIMQMSMTADMCQSCCRKMHN
jgi:hypothetical protein